MGSELGLRPDSKAEAVIDGAAIWWICWTCIWTVIVAAGMAFLISKRHLPTVRIRGIGLSFCGVVLLHLYWISCQLGVIFAPLYPDDLEFWVMGLYLPLGIGLFHAANYRFLYIAERQKKQFADRPRSSQTAASLGEGDEEGEQQQQGQKGWIGLLKEKVMELRYESRAVLFVTIGMGVQIFLTVLVFCISRKYHSSWGIPGTEAHGRTSMERKVHMGRGWEWWPSILWLFAWAWIAAPYMLWKSRNIRDTQGWRVQTIGCAVSILHAAPMWLIALYAPAMEKVNRYWIPPQWIAISIWFLEIFTIFLPCWEVLRQQTLKKETLEAIAQWEAKRKNPQRITRSMHTASTAIESARTGWKSHSSLKSASGESVYTMGALEYVLEKNPEPLQKFSALKDFSGENIAFLTSLAEWKASLPKGDSEVPEEVRKELIRERFNRALRIYTEFISSKDAEFQINLSSSQLKSLEAVFENSARIMCGDKGRINDLAAPFEVQTQTFDATETSLCSVQSSETSGELSEKGTIDMSQQSTRNNSCSDHAQFWGEAPDGYNEHVFDDAEKAIKYLVLTNTWPKFVRNRRNSMISMDVLGEEGQISLPARTKDEQQS